MFALERRLYLLVLRLHPAAFRNQFAEEMAFDFEDASHTYGSARLWLDVLHSLTRQWTARILYPTPDPISAPNPSLLAGDYVMIRDKAFTPLELARGLALSVTLLALGSIGINTGYLRSSELTLVYAASASPDPNATQNTPVQSSPAAQSNVYGGMLHSTAPRPSFAVASIRPSAPNTDFRFSGITLHSDSLVIQDLSIKDVIEFAYGVPNENQFSGGPSWIGTDKFDITAKPDEAEALELNKLSSTDQRLQMRLMLQSLLEERLHLQASFVMKDMPFFALQVAKGGLKCTSDTPDTALSSLALLPPPPPPPPGYVPPQPGHEPWRDQPMHWIPHGWPFPLIVAMIAHQPDLGGRLVVDKTNLKGTYSCDLSWAHEGTDVPGSSFFTAIQEQMGLKLQPEKGPVETILIDQIERPSPN
jgi:uncharacterized protein (TIGR03435 family)